MGGAVVDVDVDVDVVEVEETAAAILRCSATGAVVMVRAAIPTVLDRVEDAVMVRPSPATAAITNTAANSRTGKIRRAESIRAAM